MSQRTISLAQFAYRTAQLEADLVDAASPFHKAYHAASPEEQAAMRSEWKLNHLKGQRDKRTGKPLKNPERIFSLGKGEGSTAAGRAAIDRANSAFNYIVVQDKKKPAPAAPSHARISRTHRTAAMSFLDMFEGDTLHAKIVAARKLLAALDA